MQLGLSRARSEPFAHITDVNPESAAGSACIIDYIVHTSDKMSKTEKVQHTINYFIVASY